MRKRGIARFLKGAKRTYKNRRSAATLIVVAGIIGIILLNPKSYSTVFEKIINNTEESESLADPNSESSPLETNLEPLGVSNTNESNLPLVATVLEQLEVKGRAPKTNYARGQFYETWPLVDGCSLRQRIIKREFGESAIVSEKDNCSVTSGEFDEPYTGEHMVFHEKAEISSKIQIDHVVALSDAWQKGAQQLTQEERYNFATDPLNLLAVESEANQNKSDGDAATWLPKNKKFRCNYVARQVSVKFKYKLWVTEAEKQAILKVLDSCPDERAIGVSL